MSDKPILSKKLEDKAAVLTLQDLDNMVKAMEEAEKIPHIESFYPNAYCCLLTGEIIRDCGDMIAILQGPRGTLPLILGMHPWWLYVPKTTWKQYLKYVEEEGLKPGEGPLQDAARSMPISMGGTGRLVDMFPNLKEAVEDE